MANKFLDELLSTEEVQTSNVWEEEDKILAPLLDELSLITNEELRLFVRCVLLNIKANFWTMAVSPEVDQHPIDEYNEGGLVLHTKRVVRTVLLLSESQMRIVEDLDLLIAAALLHDISKVEETIPEFLHSVMVDKIVEAISIQDELDVNYQERSNVLSYISHQPENLVVLMRIIRCHEGLGSPIPEMVPVTMLEQLLHLANQVARNLDKLIDGHELKAWRWNEQSVATPQESD